MRVRVQQFTTVYPSVSSNTLRSILLSNLQSSILWLLAQGKSTQAVSDVTGYSHAWIYELVWGYNRDGADSLGDGRQKNPGATPLLDEQQQANLLQVLRGPSPDGGLWNGRKVADYLSEILERPISRQQGWSYLKELG